MLLLLGICLYAYSKLCSGEFQGSQRKLQMWQNRPNNITILQSALGADFFGAHGATVIMSFHRNSSIDTLLRPDPIHVSYTSREPQSRARPQPPLPRRSASVNSTKRHPDTVKTCSLYNASITFKIKWWRERSPWAPGTAITARSRGGWHGGTAANHRNSKGEGPIERQLPAHCYDA